MILIAIFPLNKSKKLQLAILITNVSYVWKENQIQFLYFNLSKASFFILKSKFKNYLSIHGLTYSDIFTLYIL